MRFATMFAAAALLLVDSGGFGFASALDATDGPRTEPDPPVGQLADISGDPDKPRRHFRVRNPARLGPDAALAIYNRIVDDMVDAYKLSGDPVAASYRRWRKYNRAPYLSPTHGQRYINHYANDKARSYGKYEQAGRLPVGAVIAKDSIAVTADGLAFPGPLFIMEKMPEGFSYVSGDWRYTMIMPDGSLFGVTKGEGAERVEFCIGCHLMREQFDHLYFPSKELRVSP